MSIPFFANLVFVILGYLLTYAAGTLILALLARPERSRYYEFKKMAFGVWLLITGYSIGQTGGYTLSLGLVFLAFYALYHYRPVLQWRPKLDIVALLAQLGILLLFYHLLYFQVYDPISQVLRYYPADLCAQATLVEKLNATGLESTVTDFYFREPVRNLYHYGDTWYPALFARIFGLRAMEAVWFLYAAIGATTVTVGAFALADNLSGKARLSRADVLVALGFIGLSAWSFYIPKTGWLDARWAEHITLINQPKIYWAATVALFSVIALHRNDLMGFTLSLLTVCSLYFIAAPAFLTGWAFVIGYMRITGKISWSVSLRLAFPVFGMIVFVSGYMYQSGPDVSGLGQQLLYTGIVTNKYGDKRYYADVAFTWVYTAVRVLIASWPFLLLWIYKRKRMTGEYDKRILVFLVAGLSGSIVAYATMYFQPDAFQAWTVPHACLMAILVFMLLFRTGIPDWMRFTILGLCWYQNVYAYREDNYFLEAYPYNKSFVRTMIAKAGPGEGRDIAVIRKPVRKSEDPLWCTDPNQYFPYDMLKWKLRQYHPYNISLLDTELQDDPAWAAYQRAYIQNSTFGRYVARRRSEGTFLSNEASQLDFIREAGIRFLLIEPGGHTSFLPDSLVSETYVDQQTGYRFCLLR